MRQYWFHPESESYFATDRGFTNTDGMSFELTRDEYLSGMLNAFHAKGGPYRVVVTGGRTFSNTPFVFDTLDDFHATHRISALIEGEADGLDRRAAAWALRRGVALEMFPAHWDDLSQPNARIMTRVNGTQYDANKGGRRNQRMIDEGRPDAAIAFPGGKGTDDMKSRLEAAGVVTFEVAP